MSASARARLVTTHHVFLIPGFFGFANLGEFAYFTHVYDELSRLFEKRDLNVTITSVHTLPTASIRRRALFLFETIRDVAGQDDGPVHLIGHSTGGLDARLLVTPGAQLDEGLDVEAIASRVKSVVTVSTPHRGTPLATFFGSLLGAQALRLLSLATIYTIRRGQLPLRVLARLGRVFRRLENPLQMGPNTLDAIYEQMLADFGPDRREALELFFRNVVSDRSLVTQLSVEAMDVFNAGTSDRPGVAYGSVVTEAARPGLRSRLRAGLHTYAQFTHTVFELLYARTAVMPAKAVPPLSPQQRRVLREGLTHVPLLRANDGIVPSLSQVWSEVICSARADHLDVIGHYDGPAEVPPHVDWLCSGTGFRRREFERVWREVVEFLLR